MPPVEDMASLNAARFLEMSKTHAACMPARADLRASGPPAASQHALDTASCGVRST